MLRNDLEQMQDGTEDSGARSEGMTESAIEDLFTALRWPDGPTCPDCGGREVYRLNVASVRRRRYKCRRCRRQFSNTKGTILEGSKLSLGDWVKVARLVCCRPERVGVTHIQHDLGVSYKTAQNAADRLCYALRRPPLRDLVGNTNPLTPTACRDQPDPEGATFRGITWEQLLQALLHTLPPTADPGSATRPPTSS